MSELPDENAMYAVARARVAEGLLRMYTETGGRKLTDAQQSALNLRRKQGRIRSKRWRKKNPDKVREVQKKYDTKRYANETPEHRAARLEYQKQYRTKRKEEKLRNEMEWKGIEGNHRTTSFQSI